MTRRNPVVVAVVFPVGTAIDVVVAWPATVVVVGGEDGWRSHPAVVAARQIAATRAPTMRRGHSCSVMRATLPPGS